MNYKKACKLKSGNIIKNKRTKSFIHVTSIEKVESGSDYSGKAVIISGFSTNCETSCFVPIVHSMWHHREVK